MTHDRYDDASMLARILGVLGDVDEALPKPDFSSQSDNNVSSVSIERARAILSRARQHLLGKP